MSTFASVQHEDRALLRELLQRPANRDVDPVSGVGSAAAAPAIRGSTVSRTQPANVLST